MYISYYIQYMLYIICYILYSLSLYIYISSTPTALMPHRGFLGGPLAAPTPERLPETRRLGQGLYLAPLKAPRGWEVFGVVSNYVDLGCSGRVRQRKDSTLRHDVIPS